MIALKPFLEYMADNDNAEAIAWYNSRPENIKEAIRRFPIGSYDVGGETLYLCGYSELKDGTVGLMFHPTYGPAHSNQDDDITRGFPCCLTNIKILEPDWLPE